MNKFQVKIPVYRNKRCIGIQVHDVKAKDKDEAMKKAKGQWGFTVRVKNPLKKRRESVRAVTAND